MFRKDGSSHYSGVLNEKTTVKIMQDLGLLSAETQSLGGTKNKPDWVDVGKLYSGKHKERLESGSFDWVNTSKIGGLDSELLRDFVENTKAWSKLPHELISDPDFIESVRNKFSDIASTVLDCASSVELTAFLNEHFVQPNSNMNCVITESSTRRLFVFHVMQHPAVKLLEQNYEPRLQGSAAGSRKILFHKGSEIIDCGLRLRLTSNNGVRAFLGLTKDRHGRKKNCYVVLKLQQDDVDKLVQAVEPEVYSY